MQWSLQEQLVLFKLEMLGVIFVVQPGKKGEKRSNKQKQTEIAGFDVFSLVYISESSTPEKKKYEVI